MLLVDHGRCFSLEHAVVVMTEWDHFTQLDFTRIYESMQKPAFIFDGRNILDHESLQGLGYEVWAVGKSLEKLDAQ